MAVKTKKFKVPWVDWYLVAGPEIRRAEEEHSKMKETMTLRDKVTVRLLEENLVLKKRLARYED